MLDAVACKQDCLGKNNHELKHETTKLEDRSSFRGSSRSRSTLTEDSEPGMHTGCRPETLHAKPNR